MCESGPAITDVCTGSSGGCASARSKWSESSAFLSFQTLIRDDAVRDCCVYVVRIYGYEE